MPLKLLWSSACRALPVPQNGLLPGLNPLLPHLVVAEQVMGERRTGIPVPAKEAGVPPVGREKEGAFSQLEQGLLAPTRKQ